jgi:predicted unusual protein kinase regulating ubiquinone biosynthesis (AarF/ABC1/UbiB family)
MHARARAGFEFTRWVARSTLLRLQQQAGLPAPRDVPASKRRRNSEGWEYEGPDTPASLMKEMLVRLGPAFIKIGQALSSRPDLLPPSYLREFEQLQDKIPPFPSKEAYAVIEEELGARLTDIFESITPEPVAAASLGQVYKARLRRKPGREAALDVAVKVGPLI